MVVLRVHWQSGGSLILSQEPSSCFLSLVRAHHIGPLAVAGTSEDGGAGVVAEEAEEEEDAA